MDLFEDWWVCKEPIRDRETMWKLITLCQFAGLRIGNVTLHLEGFEKFPYLGTSVTSGSVVRWPNLSYPKQAGATFLTIEELQSLLIKTIKNAT